MPDGTIIVNTLDNNGDVLCRAEDFWDFLRTSSRPKELGYWLNYPNPYPAREYELPPLSEDVTLMLAPPFKESLISSLLSEKSLNTNASSHSIARKNPSEYGNAEKNDKPEKSSADGIEISDGILKIKGEPMDIPLSYTAMVRIFGKERIVFTHRTMQDDNGRTVQYDRRSFLVWDNAGVTAVRNEENAYNISAIYLWVTESKTPAESIPVPASVFSGDVLVDGVRWDRKSDMAVSSGKLEIAAPVSGGYMEITFADSRDRKDTWQHYRNAMVEHLQAALMDRDRIRQLEKVRPAAGLQGDRQDVAVRLADVCRSFIEHMVQALEAGYSMGRSVRYLKNSLMMPLTEAAQKCSEHGPVKPSDMLSVYSGCVLLGYEKVNMKRFCEKLVRNGVSDYVYDSLVRCIVPEWELSEGSVFPEIKEWLVSHHGTEGGAEAETALKEISCISGNALICDALMKTVQNGKR